MGGLRRGLWEEQASTQRVRLTRTRLQPLHAVAWRMIVPSARNASILYSNTAFQACSSGRSCSH